MNIPYRNAPTTPFSSRERVFLIIVYVVILVVVASCLEVITYYKNKSSRAGIASLSGFGSTYTTNDPDLGYKPYASTRSYVAWWSDSRVYKYMRYDTDAYSRRITPVNDEKKRRNSILFFGCSFVFGEGVKDDKTLPCCVGRLAPTYMPYNYGFCGYGTQEMLGRLQSPGIAEQVRHDNKVIAIYVFLDWHIDRTIGNLPIYLSWGKDLSYYFLDNNDRLVHRGTFKTGRPIRSWACDLLSRSRFIRSYLATMRHITRRDVRLVAMVIRESRDTFKKKFPQGDFYVLFYPDPYNLSNRQELIEYFDMYHIKYLDYGSLFKPTDRKHRLSVYDGHPTPQAYQEVANKLVSDLGIGNRRTASTTVAPK
jgi:hypothetical protein